MLIKYSGASKEAAFLRGAYSDRMSERTDVNKRPIHGAPAEHGEVQHIAKAHPSQQENVAGRAVGSLTTECFQTASKKTF